MDGISAWEEGIDVDSDNTMYQGAVVNTNDNILKRPVKLASVTWNIGSNLAFSFNPWKEFFENPLVINRLAHYKMIRGKMRVRFLINGNPFYYGRLMASYLPLAQIDTTVETDQDYAFIIAASQRIHGYINPTTSQGCDLELPFIWPKNFLDIATAEWDNMGLVSLTAVNLLRHANNSSEPVTVSIFAYMEDFVLTGVTNLVPSTIIPQGSVKKKSASKDEYGIISGPAHTVANWSGKLSQAPYIGKYARATQLATQALGDIASLFGYSKPPEIPICRTVLTTAMPAVTNVPDTVNLLSLDSKKEVTIDPRVTGASSQDEMALVPLAMKESFLTRFPWSPVSQPDAHLFNMRVTPIQGSKSSASSGSWVSLTPSAWVALPFQYWTGSMQIRVQVVCSAYHRGRLRIAWDPNHFQNTEFNQAYSQIVDIAETTDVTFRIGWAQPVNYLKTLSSSEPDKFNSWSLGRYDTTYFRTCNGVLEITVLNELTTPQNSTQPVDVNIFTSMCEDFEVQGPSDSFLLNATDIITGLTPLTGPPLGDALPPAVNQPAPPPDALPSTDTTPPLVLKTVPANGVVYGDFTKAGEVVSPEWSNTIGVAPADKGSQLWGTASNPYLFYTFGNAVGTQTVSILFSNPSAPARVITVTRGASTFTANLPAGIGSTVWLDMTLPVIKGPNLIKFDASVDGSGRILAVSAKTYLPTNVDVSFYEPADVISLGTSPSNFIVSGSQAVSTLPDGELLYPADWYKGSFQHFISLNTLSLGQTGNVKKFRTQADNPTGQSMGAYRNDWPYNGWIPTGTTNFINAGSKITRVYYLRDLNLPFLINGKGIANTIPGVSITPQSEVHMKPQGEVEEPPIEDEQNKPEQVEVDNYMGVSCTSGPANQVYFGEQVSSWRQCLKRYTFNGMLTFPAGQFSTRFDLPSTPSTDILSGTPMSVTQPNFTIPTYISLGYLCYRGGVRYRFTDASNGNSSVSPLNMSLTATRLPTGVQPAAPAAITAAVGAGSSWNGAATDTINNTRSVAFELPYYSNYRFVPTRTDVPSSELIQRCAGRFYLARQATGTTLFHLSWAAAEDYSLSHFIGAPRIIWA